MSTTVCNLVSLAVGVLATVLVEWFFYGRAARHLREEAQEILRLSNIALRGMENARLIELAKDKSGKITGLSVTAAVEVLKAKAGLEVSAEVIHEAKEEK